MAISDNAVRSAHSQQQLRFLSCICFKLYKVRVQYVVMSDRLSSWKRIRSSSSSGHSTRTCHVTMTTTTLLVLRLLSHCRYIHTAG